MQVAGGLLHREESDLVGTLRQFDSDEFLHGGTLHRPEDSRAGLEWLLGVSLRMPELVAKSELTNSRAAWSARMDTRRTNAGSASRAPLTADFFGKSRLLVNSVTMEAPKSAASLPRWSTRSAESSAR